SMLTTSGRGDKRIFPRGPWHEACTTRDCPPVPGAAARSIATMPVRDAEALADSARAFYHRAPHVLQAADVPFLLGGAYALAHYTGVTRHTKDLDLFLRRDDVGRARTAVEAAGYRTELTYDHWLAKVFAGGHFIDLIFN